MRPWLRGAAIGVALGLLACGDGLAPSADLQRNRIKWRLSGIDTYTLVIRRGCECLVPEMTGPVWLEVRAGVVMSRTYGDGTPVPESYHDAFPDVSGLFAIIEDAVRQNAATLAVQYHPAHGAPMQFYIDYHATMADDEVGYTMEIVLPD